MSEFDMPGQAGGPDVTAADLLRRIHEARQMADEALKKASDALSQGDSIPQ